MGPGEDLEGMGELAPHAGGRGRGHAGLNMSCPNLGLMAKQMGVDEEPELGATLGKDPVLAGRSARPSPTPSIPVMPRLTPEANTMMVSTSVAEERGGRSVGHQLPAMPATPQYQARRPTVLSHQPATNPSRGCAVPGTVPWPTAISRRCAPSVPTSLAGGGGLMNWRHSVEMIMYGATVLTYCSLLYLKGYKAFAKIEPGMRKFMDEHGYETLADMRASRSSTSSRQARSTTFRCCPSSISRSGRAVACAAPGTASPSRS